MIKKKNCVSVYEYWLTICNLMCSCIRKGFHCKGHVIPEHGRASEPSSRGTACGFRPISLLQVQCGRAPRHPLRPLPATVLPRMRNLRHHRLHLWQRCRSVAKLQNIHQGPTSLTEGYHHGPGKKKPTPEHWLYHPR